MKSLCFNKFSYYLIIFPNFPVLPANCKKLSPNSFFRFGCFRSCGSNKQFFERTSSSVLCRSVPQRCVHGVKWADRHLSHIHGMHIQVISLTFSPQKVILTLIKHLSHIQNAHPGDFILFSPQ